MKTAPKKFEPLYSTGSFTREVERLVRVDDLLYCEAILYLCDKDDIEPEDIAKLVKGSLKEKLEIEAISRNVIPKTEAVASLF